MYSGKKKKGKHQDITRFLHWYEKDKYQNIKNMFLISLYKVKTWSYI